MEVVCLIFWSHTLSCFHLSTILTFFTYYFWFWHPSIIIMYSCIYNKTLILYMKKKCSYVICIYLLISELHLVWHVIHISLHLIPKYLQLASINRSKTLLEHCIYNSTLSRSAPNYMYFCLAIIIITYNVIIVIICHVILHVIKIYLVSSIVWFKSSLLLINVVNLST